MAAAAAVPGSAVDGLSSAAGRAGPLSATPPDVVERMLALAGIGPGDVVYDLGCGDGRIVIAAAKTFGARAIGVDIDPALINRARRRRGTGGRRRTRLVPGAGRHDRGRLGSHGRHALSAGGVEREAAARC